MVCEECENDKVMFVCDYCNGCDQCCVCDEDSDDDHIYDGYDCGDLILN